MFKINKILILVLALGVVFGFEYGIAQTSPDIRVEDAFITSDLPTFAAEQLVVKFKQGASQATIDAFKGGQGAQEIRRSTLGGFVTLRLPEGSDVLAKADVFNKNPLVEYAHPNYFAHASFVPNDPFYCLQWHFDNSLEWNPDANSGAGACQSGSNPFGGIHMENTWDISTGDSSVIVAILDTGVAYETFSDSSPAGCYGRFGDLKKCPGPAIDEYLQATDLAGTTFTILTGSDFVNGDDHPNDDESHGTHVTGTIAQSTNNTLGVAGMAFGTTIMPMKVLDGNGNGLFDVIADAIMTATDEGADVISMSLGSSADAQAMEDAVAYAYNNGVVVVAACGNNGTSDCDFPSAYNSYVIAVGATQYDESLAPYSSFGPSVDVVAPGGNTGVDQNGDGFADGVLQQTFAQNDPLDFAYWFFQGTSMATPHVAGLAALILSEDAILTPAQVRSVIESTADDLGVANRDDTFGWGLINANAALQSLSAVSITLITNSSVTFGILPLNSTKDTTASGTNDIQTVSIVVGPANLDIRSTVFSDGSNTWSLGATGGANQVKWEFSSDGTTWTTFSNPDTPFDLANNVLEGATKDLYLRITMPSESASSAEHSSTITIVATTP